MDNNLIVPRDPAYNLYIRGMETMRLNYERMKRTYGSTYLDDPAHPGRVIRDEDGKIKPYRGDPGPKPLDLRVYIVALGYNGEDVRFPKIIAELAKHKTEIHPFARRFLIERMRRQREQAPLVG
jgi:hypothetical protein